MISEINKGVLTEKVQFYRKEIHLGIQLLRLTNILLYRTSIEIYRTDYRIRYCVG